MRSALAAWSIVLAVLPWPHQPFDDEAGCWWPPGIVRLEDQGKFPGGIQKINRFVTRFPWHLCGRLLDGAPDADPKR